MAQSLAKILLHIVFSTKERKRFIQPGIAKELHAHMAGICRAFGSQAYRVGGMEDHVHIGSAITQGFALS